MAERLSARYNESNSNKDSSSESREKSDGFYIKSGKLIYSLFTSGVFEVHSSWRVMRAALLFLRKNANEHFFKKLSPKVSFFFRLLKNLCFLSPSTLPQLKILVIIAATLFTITTIICDFEKGKLSLVLCYRNIFPFSLALVNLFLD